MSEKRKFTREFKIEVLKEHFENQIPAGKICEKYKIHPNLFYLWKKELFSSAFSSKKNGKPDEEKVTKLEEKLKDKDWIISQIVEDNLRMKKKLNGEI